MSAALLVADSGPLIALARLDLLGLPARYFDSVLVTSSVWAEVTRKPRGDDAARLSAAAETKLFRVVPDPETLPTTLLRAGIDVVNAAPSGSNITTLRPLIERLKATGYFMPIDLVTKALASLGE